MNTPFVFGKLARQQNFTDRENETAQIVSNFHSLTNTIIISPRRWGKSSLVSKASDIALGENPQLRICRIDLFNVRSEEEFYAILAQSVLKETATKWEETLDFAKRFLTQLIPRMSFTGDMHNDISLSFDWRDVKANPDEILDLAEKIASEKGLHLVVCVDEFQNIAEFDKTTHFQKKLRAHWQQHQNVSYCLYGSKRHMMLDVFTNASMPFYKFGALLFLEKIDSLSWEHFIVERFASTGKWISPKLAVLISTLADNHPYYVQQLAQQVWFRTQQEASEAHVHEAHQSLVQQLSLLFVTMTEGLTSLQINLLRAIVAGETLLSSAAILSSYRLGSSATVTRSRKALLAKDILDDRAGKIEFQDPMYAYWLQHYYFRPQVGRNKE